MTMSAHTHLELSMPRIVNYSHTKGKNFSSVDFFHSILFPGQIELCLMLFRYKMTCENLDLEHTHATLTFNRNVFLVQTK